MLPVRLAAALTGLVLAVAPLASAAPASAVALPSGPDVSRWQHGSTPLSWTQVRDAGNAFAFVKATESAGYVNPWFATDTRGIRDAGMASGSYHFARPARPVVGSALAQARHYVDVLGVPAAGALPPVLDLEQSGGLLPGELVTWSQAFLAEVHRLTGRTAVVYTYPYFWNTAMARSEAFHRFPLWIASYTTAAQPVSVGGWPTWTFWQYTDHASVAGIAGGVDRNRFNPASGTLADLTDGRPDVWATAVPAASSAPAGSADGTSVTVRWVPGDDGGTAVTGWTVRADTGQSVSVVGSATSATVTGLPAGSQVTFTVTPRNAVGQGPTSAASAPIATIMPTALRTSATAGTVAPGRSSTVTALLVRQTTGTPLAGRPVAVETRVAGTTAWLPAAALTTGADGRVSWTTRPVRTTSVRLRYSGSSLERPSTAVRSVVLRPVVGATLSATSVRLGTKVRMTGRVSGGLGGRTVYRQRYDRGAWRIVSQVQLTPTGTYAFTVTTVARRDNALRVWVPGGIGHASAVSPTRHLRVS
jgi:lysozyme